MYKVGDKIRIVDAEGIYGNHLDHIHINDDIRTVIGLSKKKALILDIGTFISTDEYHCIEKVTATPENSAPTKVLIDPDGNTYKSTQEGIVTNLYFGSEKEWTTPNELCATLSDTGNYILFTCNDGEKRVKLDYDELDYLLKLAKLTGYSDKSKVYVEVE